MKELNWKKIGMWSVIALVAILLISASVIVYDSREYFSEYFEVKRTKLDLMSESSVDSLQNEILINKKYVDSLNIIIVENVKSFDECQKTNLDLRETNRLLQKTIEHQNEIIKNLSNTW